MATTSEKATGGQDITCPDCGCVIEEKPKGKPRSLPQLNRLFAIIAVAFDNWPDSSEFRPDSSEHLRAYLTCLAGEAFRDVTHINCPYAEDQPALTRLIAVSIESAIAGARRKGTYAFVRPHPDGGSIAVYTPKSFKMAGPDRMSHLDACGLCAAIDDILMAEGLDPNKLTKAAEIAA